MRRHNYRWELPECLLAVRSLSDDAVNLTRSADVHALFTVYVLYHVYAMSAVCDNVTLIRRGATWMRVSTFSA